MSSPRTTPDRRTDRSSAWRTIARREIEVKVRDKTFVWSTVFLMATVAVGIVLSSFFAGRPDTYRVGAVGDGAAVAAEQAQEVLRGGVGGDEDVVEVERYDDASAAEEAVADEAVDAALLSGEQGYELVGQESVDGTLEAALQTAVSSAVTQANAEAEGVDLEALSQGASVQERLLDPEAEDAGVKQLVAVGFAVLFLFTALGYGMVIAQSVVQEKESRVVEILAATVPVRQMLWGKIAGNTALALSQIVGVVVVGLVTAVAIGRSDLLAGLGPAVLWYVLLFVLGFLALASLWTVAGSLATSQEDLQSTTLPGQALLFIPYFVAISASDGVQEIVSMLPIVSTMIMPGRIATGEAPWWQVGVAVGTTVVAAVLLVRLGARLYERTLLQTSRKLSYREALALRADG